MPLTDALRIPRCTYRLQLHAGFNFGEVQRLVPYFAALGISDLYLSPIFTAVPGSQHGYDVCDYREVNAELGGRVGFDRLTDELRAKGMGAVVDFVPNHMGIGGALNDWWRDVLEFGRDSPYADFFDIVWRTRPGEEHARVLVPSLENHYGRMLERGEIALSYRSELAVEFGGISLPVNPTSYRAVFAPIVTEPPAEFAKVDALIALVNALAESPARAASDAAGKLAWARRIAHAKRELHRLVEDEPILGAWLTARLRTINGAPGTMASFTELHALLEDQHYRIARWKMGAHEINYRRFFAIDSLVGLRVERPEVFRAVHALVAELIAAGRVTGLRIDHIDGLRQPRKYLDALQALTRDPARKPLYVAVEKILAQEESLPEGWPVHGSTGYEFIPQIASVQVDARAESRIEAIYAKFTGAQEKYDDVVYANKRRIIAEMFAHAIGSLGSDLAQIVANDWRWRDLTPYELTFAVTELMANLSVYRTYRDSREPVSPPDRRVLEMACANAKVRNPLMESEPFEFLRDLLIGDYPATTMPEDYQDALLGWVLTFQQYTGAVMAKSVEDTTFYTYCRFVALNEVGCDPSRFGGTIAAFHETNQNRLARAPHSLLTTSTHDTKLSEDARARLYALSEIPDEWAGWLESWHERNTRFLQRVNGTDAPDRVDEYRFYQALLGAWPLDEAGVTDDFKKRLKQHFRKAVEEAKRRTSIMHPNIEYMTACEQFADALIGRPPAGDDFGASFRRAAQRVSDLGMVNSLAQVVLKCTVPGVPDFYQGQEVWDFSLVDPDNRRPVDFARRTAALERLDDAGAAELLASRTDGRIKLRVTQMLLGLRRAHRELFARGSYTPCPTRGAFADRAIAFVREFEAEAVAVIVPCLTARLGVPPLGPVWNDTTVALDRPGRPWRDVFTGRIHQAGEAVPLSALLADLPLAVLVTMEDSS